MKQNSSKNQMSKHLWPKTPTKSMLYKSCFLQSRINLVFTTQSLQAYGLHWCNQKPGWRELINMKQSGTSISKMKLGTKRNISASKSLENLKNSCASSWLPSPIWQLILRIWRRILLGDRGPPDSLNIITCCSSSHMRHQSFPQPDTQMQIRNLDKSEQITTVILNTHNMKNENSRVHALECDLWSKKMIRGLVQVKHWRTALA